jgi:hypothetical protein
VAAGEFGVLCPAHDLEFLNTLNDLYDARKTFSEARRHRGEKILTIDYPMLHILAGTQPMYLSALLPEAAWGMGFTARVLMIYSAEIIKTDPFEALTKGSADLKKDLVLDLESISKLWGAFEWTDEAKALLKAWHAQDLAPIPTHSRLQNYNTRRLLHVLKLCMVSSLSRHSALCIELPDVQRAQSWLLEAENKMPDIFREMAGQSDKAVIDDLYDVLWRLFIGNKKPIHESVIIRFLSGKVPSEKVMRVLQIALSSNVIEKVPNMDNYYKPGMRDNIRGVE